MDDLDRIADPSPIRTAGPAPIRATGRSAGSALASTGDPSAGPELASTGDPSADPTPSRRPRPPGIQYKGEELDAARGPGLGCFRFQLIVLAVLLVLTPLSVVWRWPDVVSAALLFGVIGLLLLTGQTIIFLLRLVAADRRGRRRPLGSVTQTVGELEDEAAAGERPHDGEPPP